MKVKLEDWSKFQQNLKGAICILATFFFLFFFGGHIVDIKFLNEKKNQESKGVEVNSLLSFTFRLGELLHQFHIIQILDIE